jgi:tricorn protease
MMMKIEPRAEWRQEYVDAWRIMRDWFYDPNMHGVNWPTIRAKYEQLVPYIANREDLNYVLTEMGGELMARTARRRDYA